MGELWGQALYTERRVDPGDMLIEHQLEKRFKGEAGPLGNVQGYSLRLRAGCLCLQGPMFSQHSPGRSWSSCFVTQLMWEVRGSGMSAQLAQMLAPLGSLPSLLGHMILAMYSHIQSLLESCMLLKTVVTGPF